MNSNGEGTMNNWYRVGAERDLGTPLPPTDKFVELTIDGLAISVPEGTSIMRAAALSGTDIPKLCATEDLEAFGSCRLCLVEIEGRNGFPASCTTNVEAGMVVRTQTDRVAKLRRNVMELYISDHPLDCLSCPSNGDCQLQDMAGAVGLREVRYGYEGKNHLAEAKDESATYFDFDSSKCIVCSRCVRACEEQQGTFALTVEGRGFDSRIVASQGEQPIPVKHLMHHCQVVEGGPGGRVDVSASVVPPILFQAITLAGLTDKLPGAECLAA